MPRCWPAVDARHATGPSAVVKGNDSRDPWYMSNRPRRVNGQSTDSAPDGDRRARLVLALLAIFTAVEVVLAVVRAVKGDWALCVGSSIGALIVGYAFWYLHQEWKQGHVS